MAIGFLVRNICIDNSHPRIQRMRVVVWMRKKVEESFACSTANAFCWRIFFWTQRKLHIHFAVIINKFVEIQVQYLWYRNKFEFAISKYLLYRIYIIRNEVRFSSYFFIWSGLLRYVFHKIGMLGARPQWRGMGSARPCPVDSAYRSFF